MPFFSILLLVITFSIQGYSQDSIEKQNVNKLIIDEVSGEPMLIGLTTRAAFADANFREWFRDEYYSYTTDNKVIVQLRKNFLDDVYVFIILATWCEETKTMIPNLFKVLDEIYYPKDKIKMVSVNRDKKTERGEIDGLNIEFVPTIVFYREGKELGRIVEYPELTIEEDILNIFKNYSKELIN